MTDLVIVSDCSSMELDFVGIDFTAAHLAGCAGEGRIWVKSGVFICIEIVVT